MNDEIFTVPKSNRSYGYRVLRSIDNGVNWVDLTSSNAGGTDATFVQTEPNSGLIYPCYFNGFESTNAAQDLSACKTRYYGNGAHSIEPRVVSFTDYSVLSPQSLNDVDRARVYLYKIELVYDDLTIPLQGEDHVIKVILPPADT